MPTFSKEAQKQMQRKLPNSILMEINDMVRYNKECLMKIKSMEEKELLLLDQIYVLLQQQSGQGSRERNSSMGFQQYARPEGTSRSFDVFAGNDSNSLLWPLWMTGSPESRRGVDKDGSFYAEERRGYDNNPDRNRDRGRRQSGNPRGSFGFRTNNPKNHKPGEYPYQPAEPQYQEQGPQDTHDPRSGGDGNETPQ